VKLYVLTLRDLIESVQECGRDLGNRSAMLGEKSDHTIVVMKPGNAGGAKGVAD